MAYEGSIDLVSGLRPKNGGTFPLVDAKDVRVSDDERLDAVLSQLQAGAGPSGSGVTYTVEDGVLLIKQASGSAAVTVDGETVKLS